MKGFSINGFETTCHPHAKEKERNLDTGVTLQNWVKILMVFLLKFLNNLIGGWFLYKM